MPIDITKLIGKIPDKGDFQVIRLALEKLSREAMTQDEVKEMIESKDKEG